MKLAKWIDKLNNYGYLRIFFNEKDAKECQQALAQMKKIIEENHKLKLEVELLREVTDNPGGLL